MAEYPTVAESRDSTIRFFRQGLIRNGVPSASATAAVQKGTERWLTFDAVANQLALVHANERAREDATMPDTSTSADLERLCAIVGITRSAGAGAQGAVTVSCSGATSIAAGQELTGPNNKRYKTISTTLVNDGDPVNVIGIDVGKATDLPPGSVMTWVSPPPLCATTAAVSSSGLVNGTEADTDAKLRSRLLKKLREPQNGGNWSHYRDWAENASAGVEGAYVYPALQGPATVHVAVTVPGTAENNYSRIGTAALLSTVALEVVKNAPDHAHNVFTLVSHSNLSLGIELGLPEPVPNGPGGGWRDVSTSRWPVSGPFCKVASITSPTIFSISANNTPVVGAQIMFFQSSTLKFAFAKVLAYSGAGPYTVTIDTPLSGVTVGDYVSPACEKADEYAKALLEYVASLAPGEKSSDATVLLRATRKPRKDVAPSGVTTKPLVTLQNLGVTSADFAAINELAPVYPVEPPVPSVPTDAPNVWKLKNIGFYG